MSAGNCSTTAADPSSATRCTCATHAAGVWQVMARIPFAVPARR